LLQRNIVIPPHVRRGITHRKSGFPARVRYFAGDCETCDGLPLTIQLADNPHTADLFWVNEETILPTFLKWIERRLLRKQVNVCYFHFLQFDLVALLYKYRDAFSASQFKLEPDVLGEGVEIDVLAGKMYYAKIKWPDGTVLHVIDSFRFYTTSLSKIGKSLGCVNVKAVRPPGLGKKKFTARDKAFIEYAKQDATLGFEVATHIVRMHEEFDVPLSISAPQFAARVFQKYYLKEGERIELPHHRIVSASISAYHGGKNGFYVKPGVYRDLSELDISSAYPHAMRNLPQFVKGQYGATTRFEKGFAGVYCVTGQVKPCRYPILLSHAGKPILGGKVEKLWVTSYELEEAITRGEITVAKVFGWIWIPDSSCSRNPLGEYVDYFYGKKENCEKSDPRYHTYKLCLNALYGKFMQNIETDSHVASEWRIEEDGTRTRIEKSFKAGGLFQPFIGTLITGYVRAYLHRLEHDYRAVHASTDSIKTLVPVDGKTLPKGLGGLNLEVRGDCVLLRNKLYLHYDGPMNGVPPKKYALHGFWGTVDQLLDLVEKRETKYTVEHLYRVNEARIQGLVPLKTYVQKREAQIEWEAFQPDVKRMAGEKAGRENRLAEVEESYWLPLPGGAGCEGSGREAQAGYG